jgi:hypothetical protein
MLRRDLGVEVRTVAAPYGHFSVLVNDDEVVNAGAFAFLGILPPLQTIRERVAAKLGHNRRS